ncbi:GPI mannosyltransferase 2 [Onthophagus taurus]|uniref:GPI mannosyltransferase 2 n=1 Tax=Onthophagus taurus TaxID=166361 RepID=UPI0039BDCFD7
MQDLKEEKTMKSVEVKKNIQYRIVKYAILSRVLVILLQYMANLLITDHDANVFVSPSEETFTTIDRVIHHLFGGFARWDAQYFLHIAKYGYTFENTTAFFPLYPLILRYISISLLYVYNFMNLSSMLLLTSVVFNTIIFVKTALILFEITAFFENPKIVYTAIMVFCFNPASIFFSAPYSECLYAYLTFKSIQCCLRYVRMYSRIRFTYVNSSSLKCIFYISLSACARSNGVLNLGFFLYSYAFLVVQNLFRLKNTKFAKYIFVIISLLFLMFYISAMILPFALIQVFDFINYCRTFESNVPDFLKDFAKQNDFVLPGTFSIHQQSWCNDNIPLAYAYVQKHYWNVGFLKYFQFNQIPNFLLATPVVYITIRNSLKYFKLNNPFLMHLGLFRDLNQIKLIDMEIKPSLKFACVVHVLLLTLFCVFCTHVQVTTRIIFSASPCIYWFCASYYDHIRSKNLIFLYCMFYFVTGTIMFSNFLPWT